jgi:hypothetical protein
MARTAAERRAHNTALLESRLASCEGLRTRSDEAVFRCLATWADKGAQSQPDQLANHLSDAPMSQSAMLVRPRGVLAIAATRHGMA